MYVMKAPNAAGSKISVTTTATGIFNLINTAASTTTEDAGYTHRANAIMIQPEDGDIRVLFDGNTPTSTNGFLIQNNSVAYLPNMPLKKMQLISTSGTVVCSVMVGISDSGENVSMDSAGSGGGATSDEIQGNAAHDAVDVGNPVKIGGYASAADRTAVTADADRVDASFDLVGYMRQRSKAYDTAAQADKSVEVAPIYTNFLGDTVVDVTNETDGTNTYYVDMDDYSALNLQLIISGGSGTMTVTIEATAQDDGTAAASCTYVDVTASVFGSASYTASTFLFDDAKVLGGAKFVKVKTVSSTGGSNDSDVTIYSKRLY